MYYMGYIEWMIFRSSFTSKDGYTVEPYHYDGYGGGGIGR